MSSPVAATAQSVLRHTRADQDALDGRSPFAFDAAVHESRWLTPWHRNASDPCGRRPWSPDCVMWAEVDTRHRQRVRGRGGQCPRQPRSTRCELFLIEDGPRWSDQQLRCPRRSPGDPLPAKAFKQLSDRDTHRLGTARKAPASTTLSSSFVRSSVNRTAICCMQQTCRPASYSRQAAPTPPNCSKPPGHYGTTSPHATSQPRALDAQLVTTEDRLAPAVPDVVAKLEEPPQWKIVSPRECPHIPPRLTRSSQTSAPAGPQFASPEHGSSRPITGVQGYPAGHGDLPLPPVGG